MELCRVVNTQRTGTLEKVNQRIDASKTLVPKISALLAYIYTPRPKVFEQQDFNADKFFF